MKSYEKAIINANNYIANRHLYIFNIIKELFPSDAYKYICEIGAGDLELAKYLISVYDYIDAYDPLFFNQESRIYNLKIYDYFDSFTKINDYDLFLSICPYAYGMEINDDYNPEEHTKYLLYDIVNTVIKNQKDLFLVLANSPASIDFISELKKINKYNQIIYKTIKLHFKKADRKIIDTNNVLILKN